jgi:hypothetical protein
MQYKTLFGLFAVLISFVGYAPYFKDIFAHKTKPHALSWLIWASLSGITFGIQISNNGGAGTWLTGCNALLALFVFFLSFKYGERNIVMTDWISLPLAGFALGLWLILGNGLASVLLASLTEAIGFVPTIRKAFHRPHEETALLYFLYAISSTLSVLALDNFNLVNACYPAALLGLNLSATLFLWWRRQEVKSAHESPAVMMDSPTASPDS